MNESLHESKEYPNFDIDVNSPNAATEIEHTHSPLETVRTEDHDEDRRSKASSIDKRPEWDNNQSVPAKPKKVVARHSPPKNNRVRSKPKPNFQDLTEKKQMVREQYKRVAEQKKERKSVSSHSAISAGVITTEMLSSNKKAKD